MSRMNKQIINRLQLVRRVTASHAILRDPVTGKTYHRLGLQYPNYREPDAGTAVSKCQPAKYTGL